jgi:hypothetical protein
MALLLGSLAPLAQASAESSSNGVMLAGADNPCGPSNPCAPKKKKVKNPCAAGGGGEPKEAPKEPPKEPPK